MTDETVHPLPPPIVRPVEPPEVKVDLRDVMPTQELAPTDVPPDPTLVELIAEGLKQDDRRATDISSLLT